MLLFFLVFLPAVQALLDRVAHKSTYAFVSQPIVANCSASICNGPLAPIYCFGSIISTAYMLGVNDECPGKRLLSPPDVILQEFEKLEYPLLKKTFVSFCREHFESTDISYLKQYTPPDWNYYPERLRAIRNSRHKKLAYFINNRWRKLTKKFDSKVLNYPSHYPVIPVRNHFVVPGGFFQVYYYWDTYWINKGLLLSGMFETVRGIIDNYADLVDNLGHIPNGGYIYLQRRSQPPMFVQMVDDYFLMTNDLKSVERWLPAMDKEMEFWLKKRAIDTGDTKGMFVYQVDTDCPRPENYFSDYHLGMQSGNPKATWKAIASACESGWDFSSRWMDDSRKDVFEKFTIQTDQIVPVDLNVFMVRNFRIMSKFWQHLGDDKFAMLYAKMATSLESSIHHYMWNHTAGVWFDLRRDILTHRTGFYPPNIYPLLLGNISFEITSKVKAYLKSTGIFNYPGGIPSTLPRDSQEQWDFPNVWAPNQHLFILSLWNTGEKDLIKEGNNQAMKFIDVVYKGLFEPSPGQMAGLWEKYNATRTDGSPGGGGEYPVQEGFGWTNGAVLDLMFQMATKQGTSSRSLDGRWEKPLAGGSPHIYIIGGCLGFLISLAIAYSLCGISNNTGRYGHLSPEDQTEALLYSSE